MNKLSSFTFITLNGFFKGPNEDTSWHHHGGEASEYSNTSSANDNILLFGRKTYEMMAAFWPGPVAQEQFPIVAENMNKAEKLVCSTQLKETSWSNTTILNGDIVEKVRELKQLGNKNITILGSGSIITQLADAGLIDQFTIMLDPVTLGNGTSLFNGIKNPLELKLTSTRVFKDGIVLLNYERK